MALTPEQIDALERKRDAAQNSLDGLTDPEAIDARQAIIDDAQDVEDAYKSIYDDFHFNIVLEYENEREVLNGQYTEFPILESELQDTGNLIPNRLLPTNPDIDVIRIPEFDGGGLVTIDNAITIDNIDDLVGPQLSILDTEETRINRQEPRERYLKTGFGGTSPTNSLTLRTTTAITPASTQVSFATSDFNETPFFSVGDRLVIQNGLEQVAIEITNIVSQIPGVPPVAATPGFCTPASSPNTEAQCTIEGGVFTPANPGSPPINYSSTIDFEFIVVGSCASNAEIDEAWAGFSNADRTAQIDSTDGYDALMAQMIQDLKDKMIPRIAKLDEELTAIQANLDVDLDPQAEIDVDASKTFMNTFISTPDISDSGMSAIENERLNRLTEITARILAIVDAFTMQTQDYFEQRYFFANERANTSRGTIRILNFRLRVEDGFGDDIINLQATIDSINIVLAGP